MKKKVGSTSRNSRKGMNDMANDAKMEQTVATVYRQFGKTGEPEYNQEQVKVNSFPGGVEPAKVSYWGSAKVNTGNYENVDIGVSISVPCLLEEADRAYKFAEKFVSERLSKEIDSVRAMLSEGKGNTK